VCAALLAMLALVVLAPAAQAGTKVGGGAISATMTYSPGVPQPNAPGPPKCNEAVTFNANSAAFVVDTQIVGYAGTVSISSDNMPGGQAQDPTKNRSNCESWITGSGELSLDLTGYNQVNGAKILCDNLDGTYIRIFDVIEIGLNGPCLIGGSYTTSRIALDGVFTHMPQDGSSSSGVPGVTEPFTSALLQGPFVVIPSN
jgi:hypothetical protein